MRLGAPAARTRELADFYSRQLGIPAAREANGVRLTIGETTLEFVMSAAAPFYHFALLVPGNRFDAALEWARARTELLPVPGSAEVVFEFDAWRARACYFHDPAGSIVELIAHRALGETTMSGEFQAAELIGLSELGLVGDPVRMASLLEQELGLELWDGTVSEPNRLAFVGEPARTLILSPAGRGWLPTGRPAEVHDIDALLSGRREGDTHLEGSHYRISRRTTKARLDD